MYWLFFALVLLTFMGCASPNGYEVELIEVHDQNETPQERHKESDLEILSSRRRK